MRYPRSDRSNLPPQWLRLTQNIYVDRKIRESTTLVGCYASPRKDRSGIRLHERDSPLHLPYILANCWTLGGSDGSKVAANKLELVLPTDFNNPQTSDITEI